MSKNVLIAAKRSSFSKKGKQQLLQRGKVIKIYANLSTVSLSKPFLSFITVITRFNGL